MNKILNFITHYFFVFIVLVYIVYEELVWERFAQPIVRYIQSLELLQKLEIFLEGVNGEVILFLFLLLFTSAELLGIYAGVLLVQGKVIHWIVLYGARVPIVAFAFWLFRVSKPKLMAFKWFKASYDYLMRRIDWLKASDTYQAIKTKSAEIKDYLKKNYMKEGDSTKKKLERIYRRLKLRLKKVLKP